jgi:hypothetical protein
MGGTYARKRREMYRIFWSENMKGRYPSEDLCVDRRMKLEWIFEK